MPPGTCFHWSVALHGHTGLTVFVIIVDWTVGSVKAVEARLMTGIKTMSFRTMLGDGCEVRPRPTSLLSLLSCLKNEKKFMQRHYAYFLIYEWPWCCHGIEINCLVHHCWLVNSEQSMLSLFCGRWGHITLILSTFRNWFLSYSQYFLIHATYMKK
jgi:hypothetical protein